ncbi:MAG: peptidoglycan-binding protein [Actinobacteria bacterium]|nr:peptidoglycan-binding protein [Actinomycetota bacterium]
MTPHRHSRSTRVAAVGLVLAFALAACSDDNESSSDTTAGSTPDTTAPTTETTGGGATGEPGFVFGYVRPAAGLLTELATAQEVSIGLAVDDINAAGGVNGAPVSLISVDEPLTGDTSVAVNDLLDQGANMILGPVSSDGAKGALETLATRGAVACSASATSPELTTLDTENVLYRTAMPDSFSLNVLADTVSQRAVDAALPEGTKYKVSILARADDYGMNVGNGLAATLIARGMDVQVVTYNPRRVEFSADAATIAANQPNAVVLVAYGEGIRQLPALTAAGVQSANIIGLDGLFNPGLGDRSFPGNATQVDGVQVIGATGARSFLDRLIADPATTQVVYGAQAYDCAIIGALAAATAGTSDPAGFGPQIAAVTDGGQSCSTVDDCLSKLTAGDDIDYEGVSGGVRFDDQGDPAEVRLTTVGFKDAQMFEITTVDKNLDDLRQQEALAAAIFTTRLQQVLTALGYYTGPIDGQWNDEMTAAIATLQIDLGVPVTGVWDEATDAAVRAKYGNILDAFTESVIGLQQLLTDLGFYTGPIDGVYSAEVVAAVKALQRELGVPETGIIDAATLAAAYAKGIAIGTPSTTVPPATTPPTTPPVTVPPSTVPPVTPPDPSKPTVLESLKADDRFTSLVELLEAAGWTDDTSVIGPITLFAPTNDALGAIDPATLDALKADPDLLNAVLAYHLVEAGLTLDFLGTLTSVDTVHGEPLTIAKNGDIVTVNGVDTIAPEIKASNGVIIPINGVLTPATPA